MPQIAFAEIIERIPFKLLPMRGVDAGVAAGGDTGHRSAKGEKDGEKEENGELV